MYIEKGTSKFLVNPVVLYYIALKKKSKIGQRWEVNNLVTLALNDIALK